MQRLIKPGLLSITFRKLSAVEIVRLAVEAGLSSIEWGGDIHVPHGDLSVARQIRQLTVDNGLMISAYGSYFRAGSDDPANPSPEAVLDQASELGTTIVRVWAGAKGSAVTDEVGRAKVVQSLANICDLAAMRKIRIATEFHGHTLTDDIDSAIRLIEEVGHDNFRSFWQPPVEMETSTALAGLRLIRPWLSNVHVFHWWPHASDRHSLADGADRWRRYFREVAAQSAADSETRYASLEFVRNDDVEQFRRDAITLRELIESIEPGSAG